ncbi:hypothetical protein ACWD4N_03215 [Streptomyces sp. NPDC002586]
MASGRQKAVEPPVEPVAWSEVQTLGIPSVERPETVRRKRIEWGEPAVRVVRGPRDLRVLAACAYLGSAQTQPPSLPASPDHTLFEDPEARRLLCYVEPAVEADGEQRYVVRDGLSQAIERLIRLPPKRRLFKHGWRIEQPGRAEIVGCSEWASGDTKDVAGRMAGKFPAGVLDAIGGLGAEGGDQRSEGRTLEWRAGGNVVMVSEGSAQVTVRAGWLDRRLAFAFALVGDD